jgi:glycosyltransferase involved in cell wall biosynthesis
MFQNIAAVKRLGHEVVLITPREGMSAAKAQRAVEAALNDFGISETVPVKRIPRPAFKGRARRTFDFLAACWARVEGFDLIWSREFYAADYASAFGLNTIVEHHHPFTARQWKVARRMLGRACFKGVAAISAVHRGTLLDSGWPEDKVVVAHSGVSLSLFADHENDLLRSKLASPEQPLILYAGSLYAGKGGEEIVLAASRLKEAKFVCIGGRDHETAAFRAKVRLQGLTNIEFKGHVPHALVPGYLSAADILIAPFTDKARDIAGKVIISFSSPLKLVEYMAAGKPIVASNIGAIPEVINHGDNGLLVAPGSVDELVAAISHLLSDQTLATRLAKNAQTDARRFTWDERVARVLGLACVPSPAAGAADAVIRNNVSLQS